MSTLAIFVSLLPFVTLSLFNYTQEECDDVTILGVYASSTDNDTLLIEARNDRRDNVFTTRACMPNPRWKIYDTRRSDNIKFYGEQAESSLTNPECLLDQTYEIPKDSQSISTARGSDYVSLSLELWVTDDTNGGEPELACSYDWDGLISPQDVCDYVQFNKLYFTDTNTIMMNITMPWNDYTCSYFAYPTFKIYNNANNKLWGKMDLYAQTYCLVSGEYPVINNGTTDDGFVIGEQLSMTIELYNNWATFACSWDWDGIITYNGSTEVTSPTTTAITVPTEEGEDPTTSDEGGPVNTLPSGGNGYYVYHIGIVVLMLLSLIL